MALVVDLQNGLTKGINKAFAQVGMPEAPLIDDEQRDQWAERAAAVADKYGGNLPFMTELLFLASTCVTFGPTYVVLWGNYSTAKRIKQAQEDASAADGEGKSGEKKTEG